MKKLLSLSLALLLLMSTIGIQPAAAQSFGDVSPSHWAYNDIEQAYKDGVIAGTAYNEVSGERTFSPEAPLTIAQFMVILTRGLYPADIDQNAGNTPWYQSNKVAADKHNLLAGFEGNNLDSPCTRNQMAQIMYNVLADKKQPIDLAAAKTTAGSIPDFTTVPSAYQDAVAVCYHLKLLGGVDNKGTFAGNTGLTRAQCAAIYLRLSGIAGTSSATSNPPVEPNPVVKPEQPEQSANTCKIDKAELLNLINAERAQKDLPPLTMEPGLEKGATERALIVLKEEAGELPESQWYDVYQGNERRVSIGYEMAYTDYDEAKDIAADWGGLYDQMMDIAYSTIGIGCSEYKGKNCVIIHLSSALPSTVDLAKNKQELLRLINGKRDLMGLPAYTVDPALEAVAADMGKKLLQNDGELQESEIDTIYQAHGFGGKHIAYGYIQGSSDPQSVMKVHRTLKIDLSTYYDYKTNKIGIAMLYPTADAPVDYQYIIAYSE